MPYFDRFDICEAHYLLECHYNVGGWLRERPSNRQRGMARGFTGEATHVQLHRMGFRPSPLLEFNTLSENAREIYMCLQARYGFICCRCSSDNKLQKYWVKPTSPVPGDFETLCLACATSLRDRDHWTVTPE